MPEIVTRVPSAIAAPAVGLVIVVLGGPASVDADAGAMPLISVVAWAPMSANRLIVACCITGSGAEAGGLLALQPWLTSSPHAHCTVPAPNTSAPDGALYIVRWCVWVVGEATLLP